MNHRRGFTLVEMLLVLAIIGIVSAIAIPSLLGQRERARQRATEATAQSVLAEATAAARTQTAATATTVMAYVRAIPNFAYPACKNPYNPIVTSLTSTGAATTNGEVGMVATTQTDPNGTELNVIAISYKHNDSSGTKVMAYVPLD